MSAVPSDEGDPRKSNEEGERGPGVPEVPLLAKESTLTFIRMPRE